MCARRFLFVVVILTLLAVAAAFAMFQWGTGVLIRQAAPKGDFEAAEAGRRPDYRQDSSWWAKPGLADDPSRWQPTLWDGRPLPPLVPKQRAATFFIHPTTYLERDRWNAPLDPGGDAAYRAKLFVRSQASVFASVSDPWAPKYRQAAYGAFLLKSENAQKALDLAFSDVKAAFESFLAAQPAERPLILAGHSQGALHLLRLLSEYGPRLKDRLVAAYVVGWPVSTRADLPATGLSACDAPRQSACVLSWQSFGEPSNPDMVLDAWEGSRGLNGIERRRGDMLCVNPIAGFQRVKATSSANAGTLVPNGAFEDAVLEPGRVGAECRNGFLEIYGDIPNLGPFVLPGNNYHVYDYALFWADIRRDAALRLAAWGR